MRNRSTALWMAGAFCAAMALAAAVPAVFGAGERGTHVPCKPRRGYRLCCSGLPTALPHWPHCLARAFSPCSGACANLGLHLRPHTSCTPGWSPGSATSAMHRRAAPSFSSVLPLFASYLLALFSVARLQRALGASGWWLLRIVGLNYIAFAFAVDFLRLAASASAQYLVGYLPFVLLAVAGPLLRLAAFGQRVLTFAGKLRHSGHSSPGHSSPGHSSH